MAIAFAVMVNVQILTEQNQLFLKYLVDYSLFIADTLLYKIYDTMV